MIAGTLPSIKALPETAVEELRSDCLITSLVVAVEELVCNSIDAGAQNIQVQVLVLNLDLLQHILQTTRACCPGGRQPRTPDGACGGRRMRHIQQQLSCPGHSLRHIQAPVYGPAQGRHQHAGLQAGPLCSCRNKPPEQGIMHALRPVACVHRQGGGAGIAGKGVCVGGDVQGARQL